MAYVINWQAELRAAWLAGEAAGFDQEAVAEVEEVIEKMTQMWWVGWGGTVLVCTLVCAFV